MTYHGNQSLGGKLRYVILRISQADERQRKAHNQQQAHNKEIIARLDRMEQLRGVMRAAAGDGHAYEPPLSKGWAVRKYGTRSPHKQPESTDPLVRMLNNTMLAYPCVDFCLAHSPRPLTSTWLSCIRPFTSSDHSRHGWLNSSTPRGG